MNDNQVSELFKTITTSMAMEIAFIIVSAIVIVIAIQRILPWIGSHLQGKNRLTVIATIPFLRLAVIATTFVLILPRLIEPSVQNMIALLGTVGLALGFALKDYASSLIAGIVALGETNYRNGDWVRIGDVYGEVRHIGMRTIEVITPSDNRVLIPHALLWTEPVINANNGESRLQCSANFYLAPDHNSAEVSQSLEDVVLTSTYLYFASPITIAVREKPWGTQYIVKAYPTDASQQFRLVSDLTARGRAALQRLGVVFASVPFAASDSSTENV